MKKDQKNTFMGEWTPSEWAKFENIYLSELKSYPKKSGLDIAVKYSRNQTARA